MIQKNIIIDAHADSISRGFDNNIDLDNKDLMFNFDDIQNRLPYIQCLSLFIDPKYVLNDLNGGVKRAEELLKYFEKQYLKYFNKYNLKKIVSKEDIKEVIINNKLGIILTTENGSIIGDNVDNIAKLYKKGVKIMGITWNKDNLLACGANTINDEGLYIFGKKCIEKMNELNIIVDVSHLSYNSFFDVIDISKNVIATHSNVYNLCNNVRNLKDEQIKAIARRKGIIGMCFYNKFLNNDFIATIDDVIKHIVYIADLVGTEYISIGSDFDGINKSDLPIGINSVRDMYFIKEKLEKYGFSNIEINNIMGENLLKVINRVI